MIGSNRENAAKKAIKKRRSKRRWHRVGIGLRIILITGGIAITGFAGLVGYEYHTIKHQGQELSYAKLNKCPGTEQILGNNGEVIYTNRLAKPTLVKPSDLDKTLNNALLSIEDRQFYQDKYGLNDKRILAAIVHNVTSKSTYGASTIDQQVVKEHFWGTKKWKRSWEQKLQEMILTVMLNQKLDKKQILATYYNNLDFGNLKTIQAISQYYCGTDIKHLSVNQAAMLAGMVQAPTKYDPYLHPKYAKERRNTVLDAMVANHKLSKQKATKIKKEKLQVVDPKVHVQQAKQQKNNLIVDNFAITNALTLAQQQKLGDNYQIKTTVNPEIQAQLTKIVNQYHYPKKDVETAVTIMDAKNGNVIAQVGGVNQKSIGAYNRAIAPNRSTGSVIKPVLDYVSAMHFLGWGTQTMVQDTPYDYPGTNTAVNDWDNKYQGPETVRKALIESRNIPAVRALAQVGLNNALQMINYSGYNKELWYANAIGLNTSTQTVASMYTGLANGGKMSQARIIDQVNGQNQPINTKQVYSDATAFMITDILKGVIAKGQFGEKAMIDGVQQAGKTGTVGFAADSDAPKNALSDAWFAGYTPQYVVVVWNGFDKYNTKNYLEEKDTSLPVDIYHQIMTMLQKQPGWNDTGWAQPTSVVKNGDGYAFAHWTKPVMQTPNKPKTASSSKSSSTTTNTSPKNSPAKNTPTTASSSQAQQPLQQSPTTNSNVQQQEQQQASNWNQQVTNNDNQENTTGRQIIGYRYEYVPADQTDQTTEYEP